ncbi:unnamed protein product [Didymodactylos carnosus]|nr:unnamed protein product [Didymodactylos carnosus]CAF4345163.1 unnamed protein product [Didymodactylos carnosus]
MKFYSSTTVNIFVYTMCLQVQRILAFTMEKFDYERKAEEQKSHQTPTVENDTKTIVVNDDRKIIINIDLSSHGTKGYCLKNLLYYNFYPPHLFLAPYIPFKNIMLSLEKTNISFKNILFNLCHVAFSYVVYEVFVRYYSFYFLQQSYYSSYLSSYSLWSMHTFNTALHNMFSTKYKVLFGMYTIFVLLDGCQPQPIPICFYAARSIGELWR